MSMSIRSLFYLSVLLSFSGLCRAQVDSTKAVMSPPSIKDEDAEKVIFEKVEIESNFAGGLDSWRKFLEKNLNAHVPVDNGAPAGKFTVWVQFLVDKNGNPSDIKALTSMGYGMEEEVIRIIKKSRWSPAVQGGRFVKSYKKQPVTFLLDDDSFQITTKTPWVLYTNSGNVLTVQASKVKNEDIGLNISKGTVTKTGDGIFLVKVTDPGRVIIDIINTKKNKKIGSASFEVVKQ